MTREVMQQALEALEARCGTNAEERGPTGAITALRRELEKPAREWVGLTDEEIAEAVGSEIDGVYLRDFRAIEAKLKEKNT